MELKDFDYHLPKEKIAQYPPKQRRDAKLLVLERDGNMLHKNFFHLIDFLKKGDILVLNNTKVFKARLKARKKTGGVCEVFLLNKLGDRLFEALLRPKRIKKGDYLFFKNGSLKAQVVNEQRSLLEFEKAISEHDLEEMGQMPLPPYIKREASSHDELTYQTVFAEKQGSVASPTAGLHFDEELITALKAKGITVVYITLHIGYGTFKPIETEEVRKHYMYPEFATITEEQAQIINARKGRLIAVGTSTARTLESAHWQGKTHAFRGFTELFINPSYCFQSVEGLVTNFHLPKTSLLVLVSAFAGYKRIMKAYQEALKCDYRFYSYGDAMLIL